MSDMSDDFLQHRQNIASQSIDAQVNQWMQDSPSDPSANDEAIDENKNAVKRRVQSTPAAIIRGAAETPTQIIGGVNDAVKNTLEMITPAADWIEKNYSDVSQPKTEWGSAVRSGAQFLTNFLPALKVFRAIGAGKVAASTAAGAVSGFTAFDAHEDRLSNVWQEAGLPENILTDFLASDPADGEMEGRFKNAIEQAGLGVVADGLFLSAKALRDAHAARALSKKTEDPAALVERQMKEQYGELNDQSFITLGDPGKPALEIVKKLENSGQGIPEFSPGSIISNEYPYKKFADDVNKKLPPNMFLSKSGQSESSYIQLPSIPDLEIRFASHSDRHIAEGRIQIDMSDLEKIHNNYGPAGTAKMLSDLNDEMKKYVPRIQSDAEKLAIENGDEAGDWKSYSKEAIEANKDDIDEAVHNFIDKWKPSEKIVDPREVTAAGRGIVDAGNDEIFINFSRIDSPEDVKAVIGGMANKFKAGIDEARRGVITHEETQKLADELGMTVPELLSRQKGQTMNAEQAVAARGLWAASGEKLLEAAKKAADPNAGPVDQFNFRKMMATHYAIQQEVIGARTETARALSAWRIPVGGGVEKARQIQHMMDSMGGFSNSAEMAKRLAILAESGAPPEAIGQFVAKGWGAASMDAVREVWVNGLLSNPSTHIVNMASNTVVAFQQIYERGLASQISNLTGSGNVAAGEAMAMTYGLVSSLKDAFKFSYEAFKTESGGRVMGKTDLPQDKALTAEAFRMSSETGAGRFVDVLGQTARIPGRFLGAEDEFFKTIAYRMEVHAQALRQATQEGLHGDTLGRRMAELVNNPPQHIKIASADAALYSTFTNVPGALGKNLLKIRADVPMTTFVIPFVKTPVNIARYTFERTPFAPLVGQWRDDIAAGGARRDLALARMASGSAIMAVAFDMADSGQLTGFGPSNDKYKGDRQALLRQGWQPYSVKSGDKYYSYNRTDPIGAMLGFASDVSEIIHNSEVNEDDVDELNEVLAMGMAAVGQVAINKTYMRGISDFMEAMRDPARNSESYLNNLATSFLPYTALTGAVERTVDPTVRDSNTLWEAAQTKLAGLSSRLPPKRDLWGQPLRTDSSMGKAYDFFSPVRVSDSKPTAIDTELLRLTDAVGTDVDSLPTNLSKKTSFDGVAVNFRDFPEVFDQYVKLAGNEVKHPAFQLGAKDFLNSVVEGNSPMSRAYNIMSDTTKLAYIRNTITQYRVLAQQEILKDPANAEFASYIKQLKDEKFRQKLPVLH